MKNANKFLILILVAISWTVEAQIQELTRQAQIVIEGEVISFHQSEVERGPSFNPHCQ